MNTTEAISEDVELIDAALAELRELVDRLVGRLADTELQLDDVRTERNHEHDLAEGLRAERDEERKFVETLQGVLATSAAIEQAVGIVAEKSHVDVVEARSLLKRFSRDHDAKMPAIAAAIVAARDPKTPTAIGDPDVAALIAAAGIPPEFWKTLTLNGAIFE